MTSAHEVPWARLNVYLLTGGTSSEYCGQNDPDSPTWRFLPAGWMTTFTVTGFRVFRLPCDVTGLRAMLHVRNNGLMIPPTPHRAHRRSASPGAARRPPGRRGTSGASPAAPSVLDERRTGVLPVRLEPGHPYVIGLNKARYENFMDGGGRKALPYLLVFETKK